MKFHDLTISAAGTHYSERAKDSDSLVPEAVEVFRRMLAGGKGFEARPIPVKQFAHISISWMPIGERAGLAHFGAHGTLATSCALAGGIDEAADMAALRGLRDILAKSLGEDWELRPGFDLLHVNQRPAIIAVPWPWLPQIDAENVIPDMETCFAAALFAP